MNLHLLPIQIIFLLFLLWPTSRLVLRFKDSSIGLGAFIFWVLVWIAAVFVIFLPNVSTNVANYVGIGRGSDLIIYGAIGILFYMVFRINVMIEDLRNEISRLVREIALMDKTPKSDRKKSKK